jgi:uncharacterized membrane protein YeaQ/YmgE (transglycosylase-associated protein family)
VVGFVLGGIAALSDKGRGLVTYLFLGAVGSSVGGALLVHYRRPDRDNDSPFNICSAHIYACDANSFEPAGQAQMTRLQPNLSNAVCGILI